MFWILIFLESSELFREFRSYRDVLPISMGFYK